MKHQNILNRMTLEEKAAVLSGKDEWQTREIARLGIPSIVCADGPHGIRKQAGAGDHLGLNPSLPSICYPTAAAVANSWNEALGEELGRALGEEAAVQGVDILLGPGLNIKRSPLCGRNFEYFSEDPILSGKMAAAYIRGIQSMGVYACPKHFAVNSQELRRMTMNAVVDERTLREIYLTGFEIAVKEGKAGAIMSSYNQVNGSYANENEHLMKEILRDEWGYEGLVVTDWGGSNDHVKGVKCRSNLEMPTPGFDSAIELLQALKNGQLTQDELDICTDDFLETILSLKEKRKSRPKEFDEEKHRSLAKRAAAESIVLLKNQKNILPLKPELRVALIGDFAVKPRYQGAGSSMVNPLGKVKTMAELVKDYPISCIGISRGYLRNGEEKESLELEALELAKHADAVIFCLGLNENSETEGMDRKHMKLPRNQVNLLKRLSQVNKRIVAVISGGSAIEMPWERECSAILHGYLGGQEGAGAMLDVITGRINPSGHLAESYPLSYEDTPAFSYCPGRERNSEYREALYVGYRYYDTAQIPVQYPFGHGLSYTTFEYRNLGISEIGVSFELENIGQEDGAEVVQLYVGCKDGAVFRPQKELKGFQKVFLKKGEKKQIEIPFDEKTFRYWNVRTGKWEREKGDYQIMIGSSVADIRLSGNIFFEGTTEVLPYEKLMIPSYETGRIQNVTEKEFSAVLGGPIPSGSWEGNLGMNDAVCQLYYAKSRLARLIYKILTEKIEKQEEKEGMPNLNLLFQYNIPFRGIAKMTGGAVSMNMVNGLVQAVNGEFFRGVGTIISGYITNAKANREYEKKLAKVQKNQKMR